MLVIRNAQLEALELGMRVRTLAEGHAQQRAALGKQAFRERVLAAFERAAALGLASQDQQHRFASLCLTEGEGFPDAVEWAASILAWPEPGETRLAALEQRVIQARLKALQAPEGAS